MAGSVRRLPLVPTPTPGEALVSWVDRTANRYRITRFEAREALGLGEGAFVQHFGVRVDAATAGFVRDATGWDNTTDMLLARYHGCCLDIDPLHSGSSASSWARVWWVFPGSSAVCPACLAETGTWQVSWKTAWMFGCVRHETLLSPRCPRCATRWQSLARDERQHSICAATVPGSPPTHAGERRPACGYPAAQAPAHPLGTHDVRLLDQVAAAIDPHGESGLQPSAFTDLISLCRLVATLGTSQGLPDGTCTAITDAYDQHVVARNGQLKPSGPEMVDGYRNYRRTPADPALMAAYLHLAWPIWKGDNVADRLEEVIGRGLQEPGGMSRWNRLRQVWRPPAELAQHVADAHRTNTLRPTSPKSGGSGHFRSRRRMGDPSRVPQMMWPSAQARLIDCVPVLGTAIPRDGQRFSALALMLRIDPSVTSWEKAAQRLNTRFTYRGRQPGILGRIVAAAQIEAFNDVLDQIVRDALPSAPDYASRRAALADMEVMPDHLRRRLLTVSASGHVGTSYRWPNQAYAWMWASATCGDSYLAPSLRLDKLKGKRLAREAASYGEQFMRHQVPRIRTHLLAATAELLVARGLDGPVLYEPWEAQP